MKTLSLPARLRLSPPVLKARRWLSHVLPYRKLAASKAKLEADYAAGKWDYLAGIGELARFSVVAGYCHFLRPGGAILELGCGEGILAGRLDPARFAAYLGVDIAEEAIRRAGERASDKVRFTCADAASWLPAERFDLVVFHECLEYFDDPLAIPRRFEAALAPAGLYIVSMFIGVDTARTRRIWKWLDTAYETVDSTRVTNHRGMTWIVKALTPRP